MRDRGGDVGELGADDGGGRRGEQTDPPGDLPYPAEPVVPGPDRRGVLASFHGIRVPGDSLGQSRGPSDQGKNRQVPPLVMRPRPGVPERGGRSTDMVQEPLRNCNDFCSGRPASYRVCVTSPQVSVLVVEDDPGIATQLVRGLERAGYAADSVAMGAEALQRPASDVVLLDLGLPDLDGIDVCR